MMKKEIFIENGEIIIKIVCVLRRYAIDPRVIVEYEQDVLSMIPEEYQGKVEIQASPSKPVSNLLKKNKYVQTGIWKFKIIVEPPSLALDTRRKTSTSRKKSATMVKVDNKTKSTK